MYQVRITGGPQAGQVLQLVQGYTYIIGRGAEAHLSMPEDKTLSRVHAELVSQGQGWLLRNKSNYGSLVGGQVVHGDAPLAVGAQFQVGGTTLVFELASTAGVVPTTVQPGLPAGQAGGAPAGGGRPAPVGAGAPAGGGAAGGGGGGGGGPSADDAKAAAKAGAAALGAAAAKLGTGPVKIDHSGPGFPYGDLVKGGIRIMLANKFPSFVMYAPVALMIALQIGLNVCIAVGVPNAVLSILGLVALIFSLVMLVWSLAMPQLMCNYLTGVKNYQETGQSFGIGQLLKFDNLVPRYLTAICVGIGFMCCFIPGMLVSMAIPIIVDRPQTPFLDAVKGALAFGKKNIVPLLIMFIVFGIVNFIGALLCGVGQLITQPSIACALWLAYEVKRGEIKSAAAESGINLGEPSGLLAHPTDPAWVPLVLSRLDEVLADHAHCEKKAAAQAMSLVSTFPERRLLVQRLTRLAQEELTHFRQVYDRLVARGVPLGRDKGNPYAQALRRLVRSGKDEERLVDQLLVAALIEARSHERLALLGEHVGDAELSGFYRTLARAEEGHARLFVDLAAEYAPRAEVEARLAELAAVEGTIVAGLPLRPAIH